MATVPQQAEAHQRHHTNERDETASTTTATEASQGLASPILEVDTSAALSNTLDAAENADTPSSSVEAVVLNLAEQYLDALYLSKTSLAYFPKSTLARARANVGDAESEPSRMRTFISYLKEMVLSHSTFDKKYRQSIPEAITTLAPKEEEEKVGVHDDTRGKKKTKKLEKAKPGKNGLYTIETNFVQKWWETQDIKVERNSHHRQTQALQADLRFREILLQIILVLEVLALEASMSPLSETQPPAPSACSGEDTCQYESEMVNTKKKKGKWRDLDATLELLVDRLCIWQSIEALDTSEKAKQSEEQTAQRAIATETPTNKDRLQDFSQHVLIPFYGPRLRSKVEELAKRMGVSTQSSPVRPVPSNTYKRVAPGAEIERRPGARQHKLQRTSSVTGPQRRPPSLVRSATDSMIQRETRDRSMTPLNESMKPPRRTLSRSSSISSSTKLSQREVDMTAIAKFSQTKVKRKPSVDKELEDAIATLRKPNRGKAVGEYVTTLETNKSQLSKKPWLKSRLDVEVGATPRREHKTTDLLQTYEGLTGQACPNDFPIPSTAPRNPSQPRRIIGITDSTIRPTASSAQASRDRNAVFQTPSDRPSKKAQRRSPPVSNSEGGTFVPSSTRKLTGVVSLAVTPVKSSGKLEEVILQSSPPDIAVGTRMECEVQTPPARRAVEAPSARPVAKASGTSIYASLGWDDDDVDELL